MKAISILVTSLISALSLAQFAGTSFEEPNVFSSQYVDTGDPNVPHDLLNNADEPYVDFPFTNGELGYNARYVPYDSPGVGQTDGDHVGVTDASGTVGSYPDGLQGYRITDADGNYILEFDVVSSTSASPTASIDYFISETSYEGDGTVNEQGSDRLRIYVKDLTNNLEYDILDTTGNDINDLAIEGRWISGTTDLTPSNGVPVDFQMVIEARCNAGTEAFFFDNVRFEGTLSTDDISSPRFYVYPNPVRSGFVTIVSPKPEAIKIELYDALGKLMINTTLEGNQLDLSDLASGIYLLKITQEGMSRIQKLVVR